MPFDAAACHTAALKAARAARREKHQKLVDRLETVLSWGEVHGHWREPCRGIDYSKWDKLKVESDASGDEK